MRDYQDEKVEIMIREMADDVTARLRAHNVVGKVVHLSIDFGRQEGERGFSQQTKLEQRILLLVLWKRA